MKIRWTATGIILLTGLVATGMMPPADAAAQSSRRTRPNPAIRYTGTGTVGGQVLGTDGKAVAGARVTLQTGDGKHPLTTETNTQGRFWFPSLASGLYDVRAYAKGHVSEWRQNVWVDRGKQTNVTLRLRSGKSTAAKNTPTQAKP